MERFDEFLKTINEDKVTLYIKGDQSKDQEHWFDGLAHFNSGTLTSPESMDSYVGLMAVTVAARMLKDYQKYLEENPE